MRAAGAEDHLPLVGMFPADSSSLADIRQFVRRCAVGSALKAEDVDDLILAISEACGNVVAHSTSSSILVSWWALEGLIEVRVRDEGVFSRKVVLPEAGGKPGTGIPLMLALVDEVGIRQGTPGQPGTTVRLIKHG